MKKCNRCKVDKPLTEYYRQKDTRDNHAHMCKKCDNARSSRAHRKRKYNLTDKQLDEYLAIKNCPCCNVELTEDTKYNGRAIDHCHTTGKVRGVLCRSCNLILGYAKDTPSILFNLIKYLDICNLEDQKTLSNYTLDQTVETV